MKTVYSLSMNLQTMPGSVSNKTYLAVYKRLVTGLAVIASEAANYNAGYSNPLDQLGWSLPFEAWIHWISSTC